VMAMLAVCILLLGGLVLFRQQIFGGRGKVAQDRGPALAPTTSAEALKNFVFAKELRALADGDARAAEAFRQAREKKNLTPTDLAWACLLEGTAELYAGHTDEARTAFRSLQALATGTGDPKLTTFLISTAAQLEGSNPVGLGDAQELDRNSYQAIALLLYGLKDGQLGKYEDSAGFLRQFRSASPTGSAAWVTSLQILATNRLEQIAMLSMQTNTTKPAPSESASPKVTNRRPPAVQESNLKPAVLIPLSNGWEHTDFGDLLSPGEVNIDPATGVFTVKVASEDIFRLNDSGHFVYQKISGDFEIVAHAASISDGYTWTKGGLMIRDTPDVDGRNVFVALNPLKGLTYQSRPNRNTRTNAWPVGFKPEFQAPRWLKLVREGGKITAFQSEDGKQWTQVDTTSFDALPTELFAGLAICSQHLHRPATAVFDHVEITKR
jgi:hypothetical protein